MDTERINERLEEPRTFPQIEYEGRLDRAQAAMRAEGLDLLVLFGPQSLGYFTGYSSVNIWDFSALVIPVTDGPRVVLWDFEQPRFDVSAALGEVVPYSAHESPLVAFDLAVGGLDVSTFAIDDWSACMPHAALERLHGVFRDASRADGRRVIWRTRLIKSTRERELLERSATLTDAGVRAAIEAAQPGVSDRDVAAAISDVMLRGGSEHFSIQPIVAAGPRAGAPHSEASGYVLKRGEGVFIELGAAVNRYTAPLMRTLTLGECEPELEQLAELATGVLDELLGRMRPGVSCHEVARAAQAVVDGGGPEVLFHRSFGYPVGFTVPPTWIEELDFLVREGNQEPLEEGMVFHLPISLRNRARRGVGMSQTVEITADGARPLSSIPAQLLATG
jgi:Xaa-Pro dipeptidase